MDSKEMRDVVEALLFASDVPVRIRTLVEVIGHGVTGKDIRAAIKEMNADYAEREASFSIEDIAGGVQLLTRPDFDDYVKKLVKARQKGRLSRAALETLAIVAYRQPLTRPEMEAIRGVDCGGVTQTLLERGLVKIAGRAEGVGRPLLYATTQNFLEHFGLRSIGELPNIEELIAQMDKLSLATDMARELGGDPEEFTGEIDARLDPDDDPAGGEETTESDGPGTADTGVSADAEAVADDGPESASTESDGPATSPEEPIDRAAEDASDEPSALEPVMESAG